MVRSRLRAGGLLVGLLLSGAYSTVPARAADPVPPGAAVPQALLLEAGSGRVLAISGPAANVFVSDPKVAEVRPASASALFVFGVVPGRTTVAALDAGGHVLAQYTVTVRPSAFGSSEASSGIARVLRGADVHVEATLAGLTLTGRVANAADADEAVAVARSYLAPNQTVENRLTVTSSITVGLRVRIAEMSREVTRELGVNWSALGNIGKFAVSAATSNGLSLASGGLTTLTSTLNNKGFSLANVIDALSQDNLVHLLAEPNLTARSGEAASFLVGGEYPIPVSQQNNSVTVEYKQYGVALSFVPTVLSTGRISLHVRPEVSQLTSVGAVQLTAGNSSLQIPALTVRRAETTVELGSGDSFVIAGLLQDSTTQSNQGLPGLGDIPILGALFRSDSFQHNQSELVIVVTPYLVGSSSDPNAISLPTDGFVAPTDLERILLLRQQALPRRRDGMTGVIPVAATRVPGAAGFIVR